MLLPFQVFLALLLDVQQLAEQSLVPGLFVFQLPLLDHPGVFELEEHFLGGDQIVHLFGLVLQLDVLFASDLFLLELGLLLLLLELFTRALLQDLQLVLVLGDGL